jgi:hypothetical protein
MKKIERLGLDQSVFMLQHNKGGHSARAELVDELVFFARSFSLTEFSPLR